MLIKDVNLKASNKFFRLTNDFRQNVIYKLKQLGEGDNCVRG